MRNHPRLSACALGAALPTIALGVLSVCPAEAWASNRVVPASKYSINCYWNNTCDLVTHGQAEAVLGVPLTAGVFLKKPGGQRAYRAYTPAGARHGKNLDLVIFRGAAPAASSVLIGKVMAEPSLGKGAWCSTVGLGATLDANFTVRLNGKRIYLNIATDTCADALKFAKLAFGRV